MTWRAIRMSVEQYRISRVLNLENLLHYSIYSQSLRPLSFDGSCYLEAR